MFSFFNKKEPTTKVFDKILMNGPAKWEALAAYCQNQGINLVITWFEETREKAEEVFREKNIPVTVMLAREAGITSHQARSFVFAEHHPYLPKEKELFAKMKGQQVTVFSALDEPLMARFGGEKIIGLMQKLGMKENEVVEHPLISSSIKNAQEKIQAKVLVEQSARSQRDWFQYNMPSSIQ